MFLSTFMLAWLVLPIQNEYHNSGHFFFWDKVCPFFLSQVFTLPPLMRYVGLQIRDALKRLFLAGVAAALCGLAYIIYMVASHRGSVSEVVGFMMAMGNTYGVFLIVVLMGNGLVALPRRLWQLGDYEGELQRLYISVSLASTILYYEFSPSTVTSPAFSGRQRGVRLSRR